MSTTLRTAPLQARSRATLEHRLATDGALLGEVGHLERLLAGR